MLTAAVAAVGLLAGLPLPVVGAATLAAAQPLWFGAALAGWAVFSWMRRPAGPGPGDEAAFLRGLAGELTAGASLRGSVTAAAERSPALDLGPATRLAEAGLPGERVGEALGSALPVNGRLVDAAFRLAAESGARVAGMMQTLAGRAAEVGRLDRERRALTAQARASAWVVGGAPLLLLALLGLSGRLGPLLRDPAGPPILAVGLGLQAAGAVVVWLMLRSAAR